MTGDLIILRETLIEFVEKIKDESKNRKTNFKKIKLDFDEHNTFSFNRTDKVIDKYPSIFKFIESLGYDIDGNVIQPSLYVELIESTQAINVFKKYVKSYQVDFDEVGEINFFLESLFCSVLQEYSDMQGGIDSILKYELEINKIDLILAKYINCLMTGHINVKIIIPILGVKWNNISSLKRLELRVSDNIYIEQLTKIEQESRVYGGITDWNYFEYFDHENLYEVNKSNIAIVIEEEIKFENSDLFFLNNKISLVFQKYHMKINSLINFISLVAELTDIGFDKVYFKCEGNIFNGSNLPRSLWDKVSIMDSQKIILRKDLSSLPFSIQRELQQKNSLNNEQLKLAIRKYNALYKTYHEEHMNRIQGALYRRTRAMMDFNETEGLLDSIIGIEQLFSSGSSELSFRLSLYVANILKEDKKFINMEKKEIFDDFKKLYSKRSKFVHLGKEQKDTKALFFLEAVLLGIINSNKINFESKESLAKQIEMIYIFSN